MRGLGLGLGLQPRRLSADQLTVRDMFATSYVAGRDGVLAQLGGVTSGVGNTGSINPWTGALVPSGGIIRYDLALPGVGVLPMLHAQGGRANLPPANNILAELGTLVGGEYLESTANGLHRVAGVASSAFTAGVALTARIKLTPVGATRYVIVNGTSGIGNICVDIVNAVIASQTGSAVATVSRVGDGVLLVATWTPVGTSDYGYAQISPTVSINDTSYVGNPANGFKLLAQVEQASFPGIHIPTAGAAVSRTADSYSWDVSAIGGISTIGGELMVAVIPYGWSGSRADSWRAITSTAGGILRIGRNSASDISVVASHTGGPNTQTSPVLPAPASLTTYSIKWGASGSVGYANVVPFGGGLAAATLPWTMTGPFAIGGNPGDLFGAVAAMYKPGGYNDTERAAFQRLLPSMIQAVA